MAFDKAKYDKAYAAANPEKVAAHAAAWRERNREKTRTTERARYASDPEFAEAKRARRREWGAENRERLAAAAKARRAKNPQARRDYQKRTYAVNREAILDRQRELTTPTIRRARKHGVPPAAIEALFSAQNGQCPVCDKQLDPARRHSLHLDHCHDTGVLRGFLCSSCNTHEGWVKKNGARLRAYLDNPPARLLELA